MEKQNHTKKEKGGNKTNTTFYVQLALIGLLLIVIAFSLGRGSGNEGTSGIVAVSASKIIPQGVPAIYGKELGVSYNDVSASNPSLADATIKKLAKYEDEKLTKEQMTRYIRIGSSIACEYCCGAKALVFSNGQRACGCAHSYAMRGLTKYLLINHPSMSDKEILSELGKWKTLFFPGILEKKAQILKSKGIDPTNYINLASNKYRGIEKGKASGGEMVGGC